MAQGYNARWHPKLGTGRRDTPREQPSPPLSGRETHHRGTGRMTGCRGRAFWDCTGPTTGCLGEESNGVKPGMRGKKGQSHASCWLVQPGAAPDRPTLPYLVINFQAFSWVRYSLFGGGMGWSLWGSECQVTGARVLAVR